VRNADVKGYQYSRDDVEARSLANEYAQILGQTFTHEMKPLEVEILVAEVGFTQESDQLFHIMYDGTLVDEQGMSVLGGDAESIADRLSDTWRKEDDLRSAVRGCVAALSGPDRTLGAGDTEVAVLARSNGRRCFRRLDDAEVVALLA
jgi:proteasome alpha subunit